MKLKVIVHEAEEGGYWDERQLNLVVVVVEKLGNL